MKMPTAIALLAVTTGYPLGAASGEPAALHFIDDDYARALAEARARKLPIFVEAWAGW